MSLILRTSAVGVLAILLNTRGVASGRLAIFTSSCPIKELVFHKSPLPNQGGPCQHGRR